MKKIIDKIKKSVLIKKTTTIVFVAMLIATFILITIAINNFNWDPIDFTSDKLYTLTEASKERLKDIEKDVNMYFIGYNENASLIDLAKQYHNVNEKIIIETATATERPDLVEKYGIVNESTGVIIASGEKSKVLVEQDFYTYDPTSYEQIDITEERLTNSILYVVADEIPTVYLLEGYSEFNTTENLYYLSIYLQNEVTEFKSLNLLSEGSVPSDCKALIIMSPTKDFDDMTKDAIVNYINNGGNILWYNMALTSQFDLPNVNSILSLYGVNPFEVGFINEGNKSQMMTGAQNIIMPTIEKSTITKNIAACIMVNASKINLVSDEELSNNNITKNVLMKTSDKAFFRKDFSISSADRQSDEAEESFIVGVELDKKIKEATDDAKEVISKLVLYGENMFVSDLTISDEDGAPLIAYAYNKDLAIDSMAYLSEREGDIVIRKNTNTSTYNATVEQNEIIQLVIYGIPIAIIFTGILVWQRRRRKV